ncbi:S-adenosyl-L-methionine-dependent methyltransferase [Fennellomyces sp. T-0311]|nr:S-adenosyl-L-methionine-dependent methyltransferase [Fennellomyces sp. T-0311]
MGNQQSRIGRQRSPSTISHTDTYPSQWSSSSSSDPYQREYPLPSIISADDGHVKLRKQSSPSPLAYKSSHRPRFRPLRALTSFRFEPPSIQHTTSPLPPPPVHPLAPVQTQHSDSKHTCSTNSALSSQHTEPTETQYMWMAGRKYHQTPSSPYMLPCDEDEVDRLHLLHFMIRFAIQGNYLAPVSDILRKGGRVLDVGCGPGSWAMEIAGEYPKSQVVGIDINAMFPSDIKPSNCTFQQQNLLDGLPFEDASFDYIFMRFIGLGIQRKQWSKVLDELVRVLKPDGWIELAEQDTEMYRAGPNTAELNNKLKQVMEMRHVDPQSGRLLKQRLENRVELTNVTTSFISCPGGQWAGKLGQLTLQSWQSYYQALGPQICHAVNIPAKQYEEHLKACWAEANEFKTFENVHFAYAQKKSS